MRCRFGKSFASGAVFFLLISLYRCYGIKIHLADQANQADFFYPLNFYDLREKTKLFRILLSIFSRLNLKINHFLKNTFSQFEIINILPIFVNNQ